MFDIVICSSNLGLVKRSIKVVNKALINYEFDYHIDKFTNSDSKLGDVIKNGKRKIYIIDSDMLDIVHRIREKDFVSIIILISLYDKIDTELFHEKLLVLDYLCFDKDYDDNLLKDMDTSLKIIFKENAFSFKYNHIVYRIFCDDINYIEKEPNIKRCIIHTLDRDYYIVASVREIMNSLDGMFIRSSQSCIINMMNVEHIDCGNNIVYFKNGDVTNLVTNKMKKIIAENIK